MCDFEVRFGDSVEDNIVVRLINKEGTQLREFAGPKDTRKDSFSCIDLINSSTQLVSKTTSWTTKTKVLGTMQAQSLNSHSVVYDVAKNASSLLFTV